MGEPLVTSPELQAAEPSPRRPFGDADQTAIRTHWYSSLQPDVPVSELAQRRLRVVAAALTTMLIGGNLVAVIALWGPDLTGSVSDAFLRPLPPATGILFSVLAGGVLLSMVPRTAARVIVFVLSVAVAIIGLVSAFSHFRSEVVGVAHGGWELFPPLTSLLVVLLAFSLMFASNTRNRLRFISNIMIGVTWAVFVPLMLLVEYSNLSTSAVGTVDAYAGPVSFAAMMNVLILLVALPAAHPADPPLTARVVQGGHGLVPFVILLVLGVPALFLIGVGSTESMTDTQVAIAIIVTVVALTCVVVWSESQRIAVSHAQMEYIHSQADRYTAYVDEMNDVLLYVQKGSVVWAAKSTKALLGRDPEQVTEMPLRDLIGPRFWRDVEDALALNPENTMITVQLLHQSGEAIWANLNIHYHAPEGEAPGYFVVARDVNDMVESEQRALQASAVVEHQAKHDSLTDLLSRDEIMRRMEEHADSCTPNRPTSVIMIDLDHFATVNEGLSHSAGDEVLIQVASLIDSAIPLSSELGRIGSDEFVAVLPNCSEEIANRLAERIVARVRDYPFAPMGFEVRVTATVATATVYAPVSATTLLSYANMALMEGRRSGYDRAYSFTPAMLDDLEHRTTVGRELQEAILRREFRAWGQPIVNMTTREIVGYEALARWIPEGKDPIPAYQWVDIAIDHNLMTEIGRQVIEDALQQAQHLPDGVYVSLNATGQQLADPTFISHLLRHKHLHHIQPRSVVIEVTESTLIDPASAQDVRTTLDTLHERGIRIFLDDFGTGYSAITHLREFPVDGLKLDKSFSLGDVDSDTGLNGYQYRLAQGMASLSASLDIARIAEGVETEEQESLLMNAGWVYGQGWLYGKAEPFPGPDGSTLVQG